MNSFYSKWTFTIVTNTVLVPFDCVLETVLVPIAQKGNVKLEEGLAKGHLAPALGLVTSSLHPQDFW